MRRQFFAGFAALALSGSVLAQGTVVISSPNTVGPSGSPKQVTDVFTRNPDGTIADFTSAGVSVTNKSYTLATGTTSGGNFNPVAGSYRLAMPASFGGNTLVITSTANNGVTSTATFTSAPATAPEIELYAGTTIRADWTGTGTPSGSVTLNGGPTAPPPIAVPPYQSVAPTPVSTTVSTTTQTDSAAFTPQLGRPINQTLSGTWTGTVALYRSIDGGTTRVLVTYIDGSAKQWSGNMQAPVATESDPSALWYQRFNLQSGSATGVLR